MQILFKTLIQLGVFVTAFGLLPDLHAQGTGSLPTGHYVVTNDDIYRAPNRATLFRLNQSSSKLDELKSLGTGGWGLGGGSFGTTQQAFAAVGTNLCVFVSDPGSDDIGAFNFETKVGDYSDFTGSGAYTGISLFTHGTTLYAAYSASVNIGIWTINSDCSLTLANAPLNTPTFAPVNGMAVAPNGDTLVVTYAKQKVDSFAISGTTLTEKGPFDSVGDTGGVDITKDSKYAIVGDFSDTATEVEVFPILSGGSLGASDNYNVASGGSDSSNIWLSPDEALLYVSNNVSLQITTLAFNEQAAAGEQLTFDCISAPLNNPSGGILYNTGGMATASDLGTGTYLYVAESGNPSAVALLSSPKGGCPLTEVTGSPFVNSAGQWAVTVSAYPPRPF